MRKKQQRRHRKDTKGAKTLHLSERIFLFSLASPSMQKGNNIIFKWDRKFDVGTRHTFLWMLESWLALGTGRKKTLKYICTRDKRKSSQKEKNNLFTPNEQVSTSDSIGLWKIHAIFRKMCVCKFSVLKPCRGKRKRIYPLAPKRHIEKWCESFPTIAIWYSQNCGK